MVTQDFFSSQDIQHVSGATGRVYGVVASPYPNEEALGIERVMVWTRVEGEGGPYMGWDWWLMDEVIALPNAPVSQGATVVVVDLNGNQETALVMAAGYDELALMFADGTTGWVALEHVTAVMDRPLTNSASQIA